MVIAHSERNRRVEWREEALLHPIEDDGFAAWPDELLVVKFQQTGNPRYFSELVVRHRSHLYAVCLRFLGSRAQAEDVVQSVFTAFWSVIQGFAANNVRAWLHAAARNRCVNELRRGFRRYEVGEVDEAIMAYPEDLSDEELRVIVEQMLDKLAPSQRTACKLFYFHGYSYPEIEKLTGHTSTEVKSYIQNGRRMLRKWWNKGSNGK